VVIYFRRSLPLTLLGLAVARIEALGTVAVAQTLEKEPNILVTFGEDIGDLQISAECRRLRLWAAEAAGGDEARLRELESFALR